MTHEWNNLTIEEKYKKANELIAKIANKFADGPDQNTFVLKSIICNAIENLFHYINDPRDEDIDWKNPVVELQYNVNIDENLDLIYFKLDENDVETRDILNKKLISIFVDLHNIIMFESLCEGTVILQQKDNYSYILKSEDINNQITHINNQDDKLNKIIELTHNKIDIPFKIEKSNEDLISLEKIPCKLTIEFTPLIIDAEQHTGYYSIIVGLVSNQDLNNFSIEEKDSIKEKLIETIRKTASNIDIYKNNLSEISENFIEIGFTGKLLIHKSLKPDFVGDNTLQIRANNLTEDEKFPKKLIFNKSDVKLTEEEEMVLYLHAIEGVESYQKIAERMFCSLQTVKNRVQSIKDKLGASSLAHAAYLYYMPSLQDLA